MDRRRFLQTSGIGLATTSLLKGPGFAADVADQKKRVGLIGSGWYGKVDLLQLIQVAPVEVVSLCDVDSKMLTEAADIVAARQISKKRPRTYGDYREMLREKDLDLVLIATPDHWHALPMIAAVQAGADVYVQKPIGVDVVECQAMLATYLDQMARALAHLINIIDPDVIVLGGGMSNIDAIYQQVPARLPDYVFSDFFATPIVPALRGDASGVYGAALLWD